MQMLYYLSMPMWGDNAVSISEHSCRQCYLVVGHKVRIVNVGRKRRCIIMWLKKVYFSIRNHSNMIST